MNENDVKKLIIKKAGVTIVDVPRSFLIESKPTYDGIVFNFKDGIVLACSDQFMPSTTKDMIANTLTNFLTGNIHIDLANYGVPIKVVG